MRARGPDSDTRCLCGCRNNSLYWRGCATTATAAERNINNLDDEHDRDANPYDHWLDSLGHFQLCAK